MKSRMQLRIKREATKRRVLRKAAKKNMTPSEYMNDIMVSDLNRNKLLYAATKMNSAKDIYHREWGY